MLKLYFTLLSLYVAVLWCDDSTVSGLDKYKLRNHLVWVWKGVCFGLPGTISTKTAHKIKSILNSSLSLSHWFHTYQC